jgi:hypothetical protein
MEPPLSEASQTTNADSSSVRTRLTESEGNAMLQEFVRDGDWMVNELKKREKSKGVTAGPKSSKTGKVKADVD